VLFRSVGYVLLFDKEFTIKEKILPGVIQSLVLKNMQRSIVLKFKSRPQMTEWKNKIEKAISDNMFCKSNRFDSFAPVRKEQKCKWYLNASQYMEDVLKGIQAAKEEIFITDWWLSPELFLKRPTSNDLQYRLDKVLQKKAKEGVKIYVLLFKEVEVAIGLKSLRAKNILTENGKNENVKVLRHPEHTPAGVFLWSHHEKCVIIDQSVAFLGGIDLCFGRWDDDAHRLIDLGKEQNDTNIENEDSKVSVVSARSGISTDNEEIKDVIRRGGLDEEMTSNIAKAFMMNLEETKKMRNKTKRCSREDELDPKDEPEEHRRLSRIKENIRENFNKLIHPKEERAPSPGNRNTDNAQKYLIVPQSDTENGSSKDINRDNQRLSLKMKKKWSKIKNNIKQLPTKTKKIGKGEDDSDSLEDADEDDVIGDRDFTGAPSDGFYWPGKDYANSYKQDFKDIHDFNKDQFIRTKIPRMPWRDEGLVVFGDSARDLARHFIQRWNQCKREKVNKNPQYPFILPKSQSGCDEYDSSWFKEKTYNCDIQMTRSLEYWSGGISETESSIQFAYIELIGKAEHFIYIENQFFVTTSNPHADIDVKNGVGKALVERIKKAYDDKKKFRVYVVLPLLPGFDSPNAIRAVQYFNLRSINKGKFSIYHALEQYGIKDPSEYITFHGMRNWSVLMGKLVQEIIYVHSKLMIVDDKYTVCGSANINDRSLKGNRDSEVAAVLEDKEFTECIFDNKTVQVGKYAHSLRSKIFRLHIGSKAKDVLDCVCDEFYEKFKGTSKTNTEAYDKVFKCIPSDNIRTYGDFQSYCNQENLNITNPLEGKELMERKVNGFIVDFPLQFLSQEKNFFPEMMTAEGMVPTAMWT